MIIIVVLGDARTPSKIEMHMHMLCVCFCFIEKQTPVCVIYIPVELSRKIIFTAVTKYDKYP